MKRIVLTGFGLCVIAVLLWTSILLAEEANDAAQANNPLANMTAFNLQNYYIGELQMLQWTMSGDGKRFAGIVHHTDGDREFAYDKDTHVGRLDKALIESRAKGWTVVDMKKEWKVIFPCTN